MLKGLAASGWHTVAIATRLAVEMQTKIGLKILR
jgi:acyl dehydratase